MVYRSTFNKTTGEFVKGVPGECFKTYMIAKVDLSTHSVNLTDAIDYYNRCK